MFVIRPPTIAQNRMQRGRQIALSPTARHCDGERKTNCNADAHADRQVMRGHPYPGPYCYALSNTDS